MSHYYDEPTNTTYYDPTMVIKISQLEKNSKIEDMQVFIVYDDEEDLIYMYGSRKDKSHPDLVDFVKTFDSESHAYDFLCIMMGLDMGYAVNTSVFLMSGLTNYSIYDDFVANVNKSEELSGFDKEHLTLKRFRKFLGVLF
jgi:hypothetical protein